MPKSPLSVDKGTGLVYETVGAAICQMRQDMPLCTAWKDDLEKDYKIRRKNPFRK